MEACKFVTNFEEGLISRTIFQKYVGLCALSSEVGNAALK